MKVASKLTKNPLLGVLRTVNEIQNLTLNIVR